MPIANENFKKYKKINLLVLELNFFCIFEQIKEIFK